MSCKSGIKHIVSRLLQVDFVWKILDRTFLQLARYMEWEHYLQVNRQQGISLEVTTIENFCPDLTVQHGPFQGLKYPADSIRRGTIKGIDYAEVNPLCGNLFPKLIGSYERELHPSFEKINQTPYSEIINVGCAEGYYTVGLAQQHPDAKIFAYEIKSESREFCTQLAELNQCIDRIQLHDFCGPETLSAIPIQSRGLILCDCEGYEIDLFTDAVIPHLKACDLLIELHDFVDMTISETIRKRFSATHEITVISSIDDLEKARSYPIAELADYSLNERLALLRENRTCIMDWMFLTPKTSTGN